MGTDCKAVIEKGEKIGQITFWDPVGVICMDRNYDLFDDIREIANQGYPETISTLAKTILDESEDWGECWMTWKDYMQLLRRHDIALPEMIVIKKSIAKKFEIRVIFKFDN